MFHKTVNVDRGLIDKHVRATFGTPFATMTERVHKTVDIDVYSFVDTPQPDQVTLVSLGLAGYARAMHFDTEDGYAQELTLTVGRKAFGDDLIEFFTRSLWVYAKQRSLLQWGVPMTLGAPMPGSEAIRALLPAPSRDLQSCIEPAGTTAFCALLPLYESEGFWLRTHKPAELVARLAETDLADLTRKPVV